MSIGKKCSGRAHGFRSAATSWPRTFEDFETFENELRQLFAAVEWEVLSQELARVDMDQPMLLIDGRPHRRVLRESKSYLSAAWAVQVERSLYRRRPGERALCPMELRAGVVEGYWTPRAAKAGLWTVAYMTPKEAEELFERVGAMTPSSSSLDRLPKLVGSTWEANRPSLGGGRSLWNEASSRLLPVRVAQHNVAALTLIAPPKSPKNRTPIEVKLKKARNSWTEGPHWGGPTWLMGPHAKETR
jgi:hypothetical protein